VFSKTTFSIEELIFFLNYKFKNTQNCKNENLLQKLISKVLSMFSCGTMSCRALTPGANVIKILW
jgi:hypothetical protein